MEMIKVNVLAALTGKQMANNNLRGEKPAPIFPCLFLLFVITFREELVFSKKEAEMAVVKLNSYYFIRNPRIMTKGSNPSASLTHSSIFYSFTC